MGRVWVEKEVVCKSAYDGNGDFPFDRKLIIDVRSAGQAGEGNFQRCDGCDVMSFDIPHI